MEAVTVQIAKLDLKTGDTLAVMYPHPLNKEQMACLRAHLESGTPKGTRIMVLDGGATLATISAGE